MQCAICSYERLPNESSSFKVCTQCSTRRGWWVGAPCRGEMMLFILLTKEMYLKFDNLTN
nr:MAG TPA: hypothetical protein [Caudoviricetes sp.]